MENQAIEGYGTPDTSWPGSGYASTATSEWSPQKIASKRQNFIELFLQQVVLALQGYIGNTAAFGQLADWAQSVWAQTVSDINTNIGIDLTSWDGFLASLEDGKGIDLPGLPQLMADFDNVCKTLVAGLTGLLDPATWGLPDVNSAIRGTAESIAANAALITQILMRMQDTGTTAMVDFSTLPNSTNLPSSFTQTYSGSGVKPFGVTSGRATVNPVAVIVAPRSTAAVYTGATCTANRQTTAGIWTAIPGADIFGIKGYGELFCRSDATGATRTYARLYQSSVEFGCYVAGTKTVFDTQSFAFKPNRAYFFLAGTDSGDRVYQLREGATDGQLMASKMEVGTTAVATGNYHCGLGAGWTESLAGNIGAGAMAYFLLADN